MIPLTSKEEQYQIVLETDRLLTNIDHLKFLLDATDSRYSGLHQSILHQAFTGQLVPQDPNDEPAGVLLERIKAERAAQGNGKAKRGRRRKADQVELGL